MYQYKYYHVLYIYSFYIINEIEYLEMSFTMSQATCGIPEVAFATFENMEYGEGM